LKADIFCSYAQLKYLRTIKSNLAFNCCLPLAALKGATAAATADDDDDGYGDDDVDNDKPKVQPTLCGI